MYRYPLETVVQTSFGIMNDRPMVLVKLVDEDGLVGVGEVWCNFPAVGAEHRARLIDSVFGPLLTEVSFDDPITAFEILTKNLGPWLANWRIWTNCTMYRWYRYCSS